jgi:hypothetical protein
MMDTLRLTSSISCSILLIIFLFVLYNH